MKIPDSFYNMLNSQKRKKNTVLSSFIADFTAENAPTSGRYLSRHSLSKYFSVLCHKLIYEIAIFHSINQETCDKLYYYIYKYILVSLFIITLIWSMKMIVYKET